MLVSRMYGMYMSEMNNEGSVSNQKAGWLGGCVP